MFSWCEWGIGDTNSKTTHYLLSLFCAQYPERCYKSSHRGPPVAELLKTGNKTAIFSL